MSTEILEPKVFEWANKLDWCPEITGFCAYVLMCENGKMYKGHTGNFKQIMLQHFNGRGGQTTKHMKPSYILHHEEYDSRETAVAREKFFKSGNGFYWLKDSQNLKTIKP